MNRLWGFLALAGSSATLVCCVIPAALVALGFGASLAGAISAVPQLTVLSENKLTIFGLAGLILLLASYVRSRPEAQTCPSDPALAAACLQSKKWGKRLLGLASVIYVGSLLFVFVLPALM